MDLQELIGRLAKRDERALDELLIHYGPLMRYIIAPILPDAQDREECLNQCAMQVWDNIGRFDPKKGSWNAWLTALTRNTARNRARARREPAQELTEDIPSPAPTPEEALLQKERQERLMALLNTLSEGDRRLFYRKYYYLQSTEQMARELGLTPRAVEGRLYRLRARLRKQLGGEDL